MFYIRLSLEDVSMNEKSVLENPLTSSPSASSSSHHNEARAFLDNGEPLADTYGDTEISLLPRDPHWMFAYWEVNDLTRQQVKNQYGENIFSSAQPTIRMHEFNPQSKILESVQTIDVVVALESKNWYLRTEKEGGAWVVELGLKTKDGKFIVLARSNSIVLPLSKISDSIDEKWATLKENLDQVLAASGGGTISQGSLELFQMFAEQSKFLSPTPSWSSPGGLSSSNAGWNVNPTQQKRNFWLIANCELIVYGATDPAACVTVQGKTVALAPDGTFNLRFSLPDGPLELPIQAVSSDRIDQRKIKIVVTRNTEKDF